MLCETCALMLPSGQKQLYFTDLCDVGLDGTLTLAACSINTVVFYYNLT